MRPQLIWVRAAAPAIRSWSEIPDRLLGSLAHYAKRPGPSSDAVQQVLGRPALTFAGWAADHATAFPELNGTP